MKLSKLEVFAFPVTAAIAVDALVLIWAFFSVVGGFH